ncbi:MAG: hypothetical protein QMB55_06450 [Propionivibrio sp.]
MLEAKLLLTMVVVVLAIASFLKNRDFFSPVKFYLLYSVFFYFGIFVDDVLEITLAVYVFLIGCIAIALVLEPRATSFGVVGRNHRWWKYSAIWALSLPGIVTKVTFVVIAGGFIEYVNSLAYRVVDWQGKGYIVIWFYIIPALNLVYFCYLITDSGRSRLKMILYCFHFLLFVAIGVLTASRSYIAMTLVGMIVCYSYLSRRVRVLTLIAVAASVVLMVGFLGAVRNLYGGLDSDSLYEAAGNSELEVTHFRYGTIPLEIVFSQPDREPKLGVTYLSLLTNYIPRALYPEKLDTGGIVFTREYAGDQWGGLSNLATGTVTEAVVNFGKEFGVIVGLLLNLVFFLAGVFLYRNLLSRMRSDLTGRGLSPEWMVGYYYTIIAFARLSFSEFTDVFQTLIFFCVLPIALVTPVSKIFRSFGSK